MKGMALMKWSSELANTAKINVMQCMLSHNSCNRNDYRITGQNVAITTYLDADVQQSDAQLVNGTLQN